MYLLDGHELEGVCVYIIEVTINNKSNKNGVEETRT